MQDFTIQSTSLSVNSENERDVAVAKKLIKDELVLALLDEVESGDIVEFVYLPQAGTTVLLFGRINLRK